MEAAERELFEETGALQYHLAPVLDYGTYPTGQALGGGNGSNHGVVFIAHVERLGPLPQSEMAQIALFEGYPEHITYPQITPFLLPGVLAKVKA